MAATISTSAKVLGITALGILTGSSLTLSTLPLHALLPSPRALPTIQNHAKLLTNAISAISVSALAIAYIFAPAARGRHPYLLYTASCGLVGVGISMFRPQKINLKHNHAVNGLWEEEDLNGEVVREEMHSWERGLQLSTAVWGAGWILGVVGIWGDGA